MMNNALEDPTVPAENGDARKRSGSTTIWLPDDVKATFDALVPVVRWLKKDKELTNAGVLQELMAFYTPENIRIVDGSHRHTALTEHIDDGT